MAEYIRPRLVSARGGDGIRRTGAVRMPVRGHTGATAAAPRVEPDSPKKTDKSEPSKIRHTLKRSQRRRWLDALRPWKWVRFPRLLPTGFAKFTRRRRLRRTGIGLGVFAAVLLLVAGTLWWRLNSGPISFDLATPWLTAAIGENFGDQFRVEVGGTVLERDEHGRAAMRIRDIKVRDRDGKIIASAPKAEVGFSSASLLGGHPRAESLNLVGAELAIRVEFDGRVAISTGAGGPPIATTPALASTGTVPVTPGPTPGTWRTVEQKRNLQDSFAAFLTWLDSLNALGLDGGELAAVGLKSGNLIVDDRRNGRQSKFENIHLSVNRPSAGVLEVQLGSEDKTRPWLVVASLKPGANGTRDIDLDAQKVSIKDLMLALRIDNGGFDTDLPVSATLRSEFDRDGTPRFVHGRLQAGPGAITDLKDPLGKIAIDRADVTMDWDAEQGMLAMPFQLVSGGTRMTLSARAQAPRQPNGSWALSLSGGSVVLPPQSPGDEPLQLNRVQMQGRFDPVARKLTIADAEVAGKGVGVAMSGSVDFATGDPRLSIGVAARNMSLAHFKQLWPPFVNPPVRNWVLERVGNGTVEQGEIATNAPLSTLRSGGPPVPDDGLYVQVTTSGTTVKPFDNLPDIRDADLVTRVKGRNATVSLGRGTVQMPSGRRLTLANGAFEVPDTEIKRPPSKVRIRLDGPVAAAAELLSFDRLRDAANLPLDPAATRGNLVATFNMAMPLGEDMTTNTVTYSIGADIANFAADKFLMSQKVEAQNLRATANNQGYQVKGEMRIGGAPASVDLRHNNGETDAEVLLNATLDAAARARMGLDPAGGITGPVGLQVKGRVAFSGEQDTRLLVDADFTQAKIDNAVPGWTKSAARPARASFIFVGRGKSMRFDDLAFDGGGASIRGNVEFDQNGDVSTAIFPTFGFTDGDRANLRVDRGSDGLYKVVLRGDSIDGRGFVKSSMSGVTGDARKGKSTFDFDLDAKLGSITGFKNEAMRNFDLHMVKRAGVIRGLALNARFSSDGNLQGELRGKPGERPYVIIESTDAGGLFRFTDTYSHMIGGSMYIAMDPPTPEGTAQEGLLEVRDFYVRGDQGLDGVAGGFNGQQNGVQNGIQFSAMKVRFTKSPGVMSIHEGRVTGPMLGATIDGVMNYAANELHLRGTFIPLYGLNSALGDVPVVGLLLGGKEGLIGSMPYEVVGSPGAPILNVNAIGAVAPGIVRKFMEFPQSGDRFPDPWRQQQVR